LNFAAALERFGNQPALLLENGVTVSYANLAQQADALYQADHAPKAHRSLVAIECDNQVVSVAGYLGALRNGFPALLVNADLPQELRDRLYDNFSVPAVLSSDAQWHIRDCAAPKVHPDLALLLSTSGSTGSPKLVKLTLANLYENAKAIATYLSIDDRERPITTLPLHYSYGLSVLNSHLACGAAIVLTGEPVTSRKFWDCFREHQATSFAGVPTIYSMLRQLRFERMALPSLRYMTQAGGKMDAESVRWFVELTQSRKQRFYIMYGQTEATARMSYVPFDQVLEKADSIGIPIPNGHIDLVAEDGTLITASGVVGELRYTGPNVMMGYAVDHADLAAGDTQGGSLLTGDLAKRDDDGYFYITGRLKRFIKVFGNRIGLDEVESQLRDKGFNVAVTGRDDLLVVALAAGHAESAALSSHISKWYKLHQSGILVMVVPAFPMSAAGKIQYEILLNKLAH
jgi:long-chain acyl-CoA synthetase